MGWPKKIGDKTDHGAYATGYDNCHNKFTKELKKRCSKVEDVFADNYYNAKSLNYETIEFSLDEVVKYILKGIEQGE